MTEESNELNLGVKSLKERFEQLSSGVIHHHSSKNPPSLVPSTSSTSINNNNNNNNNNLKSRFGQLSNNLGSELSRTKSEGAGLIHSSKNGSNGVGIERIQSNLEIETNTSENVSTRPNTLRRRSSSLVIPEDGIKSARGFPFLASTTDSISSSSSNNSTSSPLNSPLPKFKPPPPIPAYHSRPTSTTPSTSTSVSLSSSPIASPAPSIRKAAPPPPPSRSNSNVPVLAPPSGSILTRAATYSTTSRSISKVPPPIPSSSLRNTSLKSSPSVTPPSESTTPTSDTFSSSSINEPVEEPEVISSLESSTILIPISVQPLIPARPIIPPRPGVILISQESKSLPPPIPSRATSQSSIVPSTILAVNSSQSILSSSPQPFLLPPPPPPRRSASPIPINSLSITRSRSSSLISTTSSTSTPPKVRLPYSIPNSPPSSTISLPLPNTDNVPYLPPPPPSRAIAPNERLAPQRPAIELKDQDDSDVSDNDDDSIITTSNNNNDSFAKSQEFPDATFANRRPPILRNRKSIQATGQIYSFAIRGIKAVSGQHHVYIWNPSHINGTSESSVSLPGGEHKVHAIEFKPTDSDKLGNDTKFVWGGTKDGHVFEIDTIEYKVSNVRLQAHSHSVTHIFRLGRSLITLDDSGKLLIWGNFDGLEAPDLNTTPKAQRIADKQTFVGLVGDEIWTSSGPSAKSSTGTLTSLSRGPQIRVYDPTGRGTFLVTPRPITTPESFGQIGAVTASAIVPSQNHLVYLGHENGFISIWSRKEYVCLNVQKISPYMITSMVGVGNYLWTGFRTGFIFIYDVQIEPWKVRKAWKAHKEAVVKIVVDSASLWTDDTLQVASCGTDLVIQFWDGLLRTDWIDSEMQLRQTEYCSFRTIRSLSISWNIDASKPNDLIGPAQNVDFLHQCLTSVNSPDIISFGFQEMIDLENKSLTAKTILLGKKKSEKFTDGVSSSYRLWHDKLVQAVRLAMPAECPYTVVHVGDLVGSEAVNLRDVAMINVKTGMKGRYGNKGGLLARFVIDDTSICYINVHLAAGQTHRRDRDSDLVDILSDKSAFSLLSTSSPGAYASGGEGNNVFDHELCILGGDLNYRIDGRRDWVIAEIEKENWEGLMALDQLRKGLEGNLSFRLRSFKEEPINFAPTYKYDPGTDNYDSSVKRRIPAWCDRILYRADNAEKVTPLHYQRYECNISDHKPISAAFDFRVKSILPDERASIWEMVEEEWKEREVELLKEARVYYRAT